MPVRPPLYQSVADEIRRLIKEGNLQRGSRLPGEDELARDLKVGRSSVREALNALEREGLIIRRHGVGNFISQNFDRMRGNLETLESFAESIRRSGYEVRVETLGAEIRPAGARAAQALGVAPETNVWHIQLLYYGDGRPAILSRTSVPVHPGIALPPGDSWPETSIREYLSKEMGIRISCAFLTIFAVAADPEAARHLGKEPGAPLLLLDGPAYNEEGAPVYHTDAFFNTDVYQFNVVRR